LSRTTQTRSGRQGKRWIGQSSEPKSRSFYEDLSQWAGNQKTIGAANLESWPNLEKTRGKAEEWKENEARTDSKKGKMGQRTSHEARGKKTREVSFGAGGEIAVATGIFRLEAGENTCPIARRAYQKKCQGKLSKNMSSRGR